MAPSNASNMSELTMRVDTLLVDLRSSQLPAILAASARSPEVDDQLERFSRDASDIDILLEVSLCLSLTAAVSRWKV